MKIINTISKTLLIVTVLFIHQIGFSQFTIPPKPSFQTSVYDYANLLSANEKTQLEQKLIRYSDSTSTQIVVVTEETINGEDIGILAPKWGHQWGVGQAKEDNGVFILVAKNERKIWIAPGYGVEDRLVAGITGEITRNIIIPEFKAGSFYNGLDKGSDAIFKVLKGEYKGTRKVANQKSNIPIGPILIFIFIIIMFIFRNRNGGGGGGGLLSAIILSNLGRGDFGGGSSGGGFSGSGGFGGGFGGGGFSGGGAGGSW